MYMEKFLVLNSLVGFLIPNSYVEAVGTAELEEIRRRGPDWCQEWKGGVKAGDSKDQDAEEEVIPAIRLHTHSINNGETHGIAATGSSLGKSSMKAELISKDHPVPRQGGQSALKP